MKPNVEISKENCLDFGFTSYNNFCEYCEEQDDLTIGIISGITVWEIKNENGNWVVEGHS